MKNILYAAAIAAALFMILDLTISVFAALAAR